MAALLTYRDWPMESTYREALEVRTNRVVAAIRSGSYVSELSDEELKAEWPEDPARAANRIAAMLNATHGELGFWFIGIDEKTQSFVGSEAEDLASWWPAVQRYFDEVSPILRDHVVMTVEPSQQIIALCFDGSSRPFVVTTGQSPAERWIPWRDATRLRAARRSEIVSLLTVIRNGPLHREAVKLQIGKAQEVLSLFKATDKVSVDRLAGVQELVSINASRTFRALLQTKGQPVPQKLETQLKNSAAAKLIKMTDDLSVVNIESVAAVPEQTTLEDRDPVALLFGSVDVGRSWRQTAESVGDLSRDPLLAPVVREALTGFLEALHQIPNDLADCIEEAWPQLTKIEDLSDEVASGLWPALSNSLNRRMPNLSDHAEATVAAVLKSLGIAEWV